ncbi:MAG: PSD1 and planctomycete cytochrome C domain-containing protein [Aureliella sp.]
MCWRKSTKIDRSLSRSCLRKTVVAVLLFFSVATTGAAGERTQPDESTAAQRTVDFSRDIQPLLNKHCVACHGGVKQASDLSFIYRDDALWVVEPGSPEDSTMIDRMKATDDDERMPPPEHGAPLTAEEIELFEQWIREGAPWAEHWSFVAPKQADAPNVRQQQWPRSKVDSFVLATLEDQGMAPAAAAKPERWLRRVSLDLTGIPPTLEECDEFLEQVNLQGEKAYETAVDRLLRSPRFGERWASIWLDAVRYADSKGLGQDGRRTIWKYRDWVIDAFNRDMPFDEFTVAQIAGDLLPKATMEDYVATACQRLTQTNEEGGTDDEQFRLEAVLDRVNTNWQVWQGLTFGCVQCHSHPYDPIQHDEYYKYLAFFNNTVDCDISNDDPRLPVPEQVDDYPEAIELDRQISELRQQRWEKEVALLKDESLWTGFKELQVSSKSQTKLAVEQQEESAQFITVGTVAKNTDIQIEVVLPKDLEQVTAFRVSGWPSNPETAIADSEWGFVLSHVSAKLVDGTAGENAEQAPLKIKYVIADEASPLMDPQQSLNPKSSQGFGAYSRINFKREAAFVLAEPVQVSKGAKLVVTLLHKIVETGAFPLVTKRGTIAVTASPALTDSIANYEGSEESKKLADLKRKRSKIRSVMIPVLRERASEFTRPSYVFERGNFLVKGDQVEPNTPQFLPPLAEAEAPARLRLANWIASPENPLTARVTVNRFWGSLFGTGIVETQEDFGSSGASPSHPELLDDLASRFALEMNWSVKTLLRELVLSSTYRQSGQATRSKIELDPQNRLLCRGPRNRLSAEVVRDQALAISGLLSDKMHGPPVYPPLPAGVWKPFQGGDKWNTPKPEDPNRFRRSVYTYTKRSIPFPIFAAFDAPSREFCSARRLPSNTPLQALMTLNDQAFVEAAEALAKRMLQNGESLEQQLSYGFRLATLRVPSEQEIDKLVMLYQSTVEKLKGGSDDSNSEFDKQTLRAMSNVATVLLNLDEVLCQ